MPDTFISKDKIQVVGHLKWYFDVWFQLETGEYPPKGYRHGDPVVVTQVDKNLNLVKIVAAQSNEKPMWAPQEYVDFDFDLLTQNKK